MITPIAQVPRATGRPVTLAEKRPLSKGRDRPLRLRGTAALRLPSLPFGGTRSLASEAFECGRALGMDGAALLRDAARVTIFVVLATVVTTVARAADDGAMPAFTAPVASASYAPVPGGSFQSVLPAGPSGAAAAAPVSVRPYSLRAVPVSNAEFLAFVTRHPEWLRGSVPRLLTDAGYLRHWQSPLVLGDGALPDQPATQVSWYAARAFCEAENARLPDWYEWELAAAADATRADARGDPAWRQRILDWYAKPGSSPLPRVGRDDANVYGIHDLPTGVWEWVEDFGALMASSDSRVQGDPDLARFCGAGALSMKDRENYAVLMRLAMLSALQADYTTRNLGFRCARPVR